MTNAVLVDDAVTVALDASRSGAVAVASSVTSAADPLVATIISRYQTLLQGKASATRFRGIPSVRAGGHSSSPLPVLKHVSVAVTGGDEAALALGPDTDETYTVEVKLSASSAVASVEAKTAFGLRHGLETLAQLVSTPSGTIAGVNRTTPLKITDGPAWPYRGLMIDTGALTVLNI